MIPRISKMFRGTEMSNIGTNQSKIQKKGTRVVFLFCFGVDFD